MPEPSSGGGAGLGVSPWVTSGAIVGCAVAVEVPLNVAVAVSAAKKRSERSPPTASGVEVAAGSAATGSAVDVDRPVKPGDPAAQEASTNERTVAIANVELT